MKALLLLFIVLTLHLAKAQPTDPPPTNFEQSLQTAAVRLAGETLQALETGMLDQIQAPRITYSGIAVEFANLWKVDSVLQLFNPAAPLWYGTGTENALLDPISRRVSGLKLFSIRF